MWIVKKEIDIFGSNIVYRKGQTITDQMKAEIPTEQWAIFEKNGLVEEIKVQTTKSKK